jgi:ATP-dependent Clp protease, protease subunit
MEEIQAMPQANKPVQLMAFNVRSEGDTMNLDVYETIGESFWGDSISAKDVLGKLRDAKPKSIKVRINSGGGDLFDGIAIHNLLRASGASVEVTVDGVAASAASVIAIAADPGKLTIAEGAYLMIHEARGGIWGTATDLEGAAKLIRKANATMASMYSKAAAKRGVMIDPATFAALMAEETWLDGHDAMLAGLADQEGESIALAASIDLSAFRKTPPKLIARALETPAAISLGTWAPKQPVSATSALSAITTPPILAPIPAPVENNMSKELEAALDAHKAEVAALSAAHTKAIETLTAEKATLTKSVETLTIENSTFKSQNEALATERDKLSADIEARDAKLLDAEVDALVPNVLDPAERDNFVALAKTSRPLFDSMIAQRKPRNLTTQTVDTELPPADSNTAVGADAKFDELVAKDLT